MHEGCSARSEQIVLHEDEEGRGEKTIAERGRGFNRRRFDSRINGKLIFYAREYTVGKWRLARD